MSIPLETSNFLEQEWYASRCCRFYTDGCSIIHPGTSCSMEFIKKLRDVCAVGLKYYVLFHFVPMLLRLKKCQNKKMIALTIIRTLKDYAVLFMGFLVGGVKNALCFICKNTISLDGYFLSSASVISSFSIYFEEGSRRRQIGYFVLTKALRSIYVNFKRMNWINFSNEETLLHVIFSAVLFYVYHHQPEILKFRNIFQMLLGDD